MNIEKSQVIEIIRDAVGGGDCELVEVHCSLKQKYPFIRILIDRSGGVKVDDCQRLSRLISDRFDRDELFSGNYRLEVSSPGIDRPLKTERDFARNVGRNVIVKYRSAEGEHEITGIVISGSPELKLRSSSGKEIELTYDSIVQGKIKLQW